MAADEIREIMYTQGVLTNAGTGLSRETQKKGLQASSFIIKGEREQGDEAPKIRSIPTNATHLYIILRSLVILSKRDGRVLQVGRPIAWTSQPQPPSIWHENSDHSSPCVVLYPRSLLLQTHCIPLSWPFSQRIYPLFCRRWLKHLHCRSQ